MRRSPLFHLPRRSESCSASMLVLFFHSILIELYTYSVHCRGIANVHEILINKVPKYQNKSLQNA